MAKDDGAGQLGIQQEINKVLAARDAMLQNQQKLLSAQVSTAVQLCKALECKDLDQVAARLDEINSGLQDAASNAEAAAAGQSSVADAAGSAGDAAEKAGTGFQNLTEKISASKAAGIGAASGIAKGMKNMGAQLEATIGQIKAMASGLMNVGKSIISIPFKILGGLTDMATAGGGGANEMRKAFEEVRGEFGSLASGEGKAVVDGFNDLTSAGGALAQTGLSVASIYGRGKAGMAAALKDVAALAGEAGAAFHMLSGSIADNAGQMLMMNKGLGMSNAALVEMTRQAQNAGKDVGEMLTATASMALTMGDKFGISAKTMGKNMSALTENFEKLGKMSTKQLGATAAYMAKLGLEASDLLGVVDKFDNFEDAAGSVSHLNQAFGMQLDAMEMMNAENPAERIDMMRDAFHEAGKSVEDMTRQEKALLAEQMGLSVSAMENALAAENQGVSYEDLEAGAEEAEENSMSQEEAMSKLADSIEKLTEGGGAGIKGFFDAFTKGFMRGMRQGEGFQELMGNIRESLNVVKKFGEAAGKMFGDLMGEMGVWDGLKDIFDPGDIAGLLGINEGGGLTGTGILGIFGKFKDSLTGKGNYSPQQMAEDMGKEFSKFFGKKGPAFDKLKKALATGIQMIGAMIAGFIPFIIGKMVELIGSMADALRNPAGLGDAASSGIGGAIVGAVMGIGEALQAALPSLIAALLDLLAAAATNPTVLKVAGGYFAFMFVKMMLMGALSAAKAALFQVVVAKLAKMMTGGVDDAAKKASKGKGAKSMGKSFKKGFSDFADGLKQFVKRIGKIKPTAILKAAAIMALIAMSFLPTLAIFAAGLVMVTKILMKVPIKNLMASVIALKLLIPPLDNMIWTFGEIKAGKIGKAMLGAILGAVFVGVALLAFSIAVALVAPIIKAVGVGNFLIVGLVGLAIGMAAIGLAAMMPSFGTVGSMASAFGMALLGAVLGAVLLTVGVIAFSIAVGLAAPIVNGVGVGNFFAVALAMVAVAIAAVALTVAAVALAIGIVAYPLGAVGAVLAAVMFAALAFVTLPALAMFQGAMAGVGFMEIGIALLQMLVVAWGAVWLALPFIVGIAFFALGTIGALIGAAFIGIGLSAMAIALMVFQALYSAVDLPGIAATMAMLTFTMAFLIPLALLSAVIAVLTPVMIVGGIGLLVAAAFIGVVALTVGPAITMLMDELGHIDGGNFIKIVIGMGLAFDGIIRMAKKAKGLVKYLFPGMMKPIRAGFRVFEKMADAMLNSLTPALKEIANLPIGDPKLFMMKIDALLKIFDAVQQMGDLVYKIAMLDVLASSGGGESGAILQGASDFINAIFGGAKDLIMALVKMLSVMKEGDIAKLEAIGGVLSAIGNLITAMQPPPGLMDAIADMAGGSFFKSGDPEGAATLMKTYGDMMGMIMQSVKENIPPMIKEILAIDIGDDPCLAKAKVEVIGGAVDAVAKMIEAIGSIAGIFMERNASQQSGIFYKSGPTMAETMVEMNSLFTMIFSLIRANLPSIIRAVLSVDIGEDPCAAKQKIEVIAAAMDAVAKFAETIGTMSQLIPEDTGSWWPFGESADPLEEMMKTVSMIVEAVSVYMPALVAAVIGIPIPGDPCAALMKLKVISASMEAVASFADNVSKIASLDVTGYTDFAAMASWMIYYTTEALIGNSGWNVKYLFEVLGELSFDESAGAPLEAATGLMCKMNEFAAQVSQLSGVSAMLGEGEGIGAAVEQMVTEVNRALFAMAYLAPIDANVALDSFAAAVGTGGGEFTINNDPINITLNVSVTMDANKVGKVLVDKSVMTTPLAAAEG